MIKKIIAQGIIIIALSFMNIHAQKMDCISILKYRQASPPFQFSNLSKSAECTSGNTYEYVIPLDKGKEYRLSFFASSIFNNKIKFRIINLNTLEKVLDLDGESEPGGISALGDYFNDKINKIEHPHFDFHPTSSTTLKVIIDIPDIELVKKLDETWESKAEKDTISGCITVFIQYKNVGDFGFR